MGTGVCTNQEWDLTALQADLPRHVKSGSLRYSNFQEIGRGGKAEVFRCQDDNLGREVAYKVLHHTLLANPLEHQMLAREARLMAAIDHASIPQIHDLGRDRFGRPYFTMSYLEGDNLYDLLSQLQKNEQGSIEACAANEPTAKVKPAKYQASVGCPRVISRAGIDSTLSLEELLASVVKVAETLQHVHELGIIHGDIKPENIVVADNGVTYLIDWGLASVVADSQDETARLESQWGRQGSPFYMSPEQVAGETDLRPSSDIYSLGVVLYECLAFQPPIQGKTARETLQLIPNKIPELPSKLQPERNLPAELERVCLRALNKNPEKRFATMGEFYESLRDCYLDMLANFERA